MYLNVFQHKLDKILRDAPWENVFSEERCVTIQITSEKETSKFDFQRFYRECGLLYPR